MVRDFMSFLKESVSSVLDDGCPFSELKPALLMYLANIASMTSAEFAEPYHGRLRWVERDLRERERLQTPNLQEMASAQVTTVITERNKFLTWTEEESASIMSQIIVLQASRDCLENERLQALTTAEAQTETIALGQKTIREAQALVDKTRREYEIVMERLGHIEDEGRRLAADLQAREEELALVETRVNDVLSVSEEELRDIAMKDAQRECEAKLWDVEERLRSVGGVAPPPAGLS
jgi:hypothetical protein